MDEDKLRLLSTLEKHYPDYRNFSDFDKFPHLIYLYEKKFIDLRSELMAKVITVDQLLADGLVSFRKSNGRLRVRLSAYGLDAINELARKLSKEKGLTSSSSGKLEAITNSPWYQETKDLILSFLAKFASESIK